MGKVLAKMREDKKANQAEAAENCNISRSSWSRLESGEMLPDALQIHQIEQYFGMDTGDFMAKVNKYCKRLEKEGVEIEYGKASKSSGAGLLLLGATLATLIGGLVLAGQSSDDTKNDEDDTK